MRFTALLLVFINSAIGAEPLGFETPGPVPSAELLPPAWLSKTGPTAHTDGLHATYEL
jgi:hypothetical protein